MKFDPMKHGAGAREFAPPGYDGWTRADALNASDPGPDGSMWVPWQAVWIKDGVSPRVVYREVVERYAANFGDLPPITVQAGTWALIGGAHRLDAAQLAGSDFILIREVACRDEDLPVLAFLDNATHGHSYTTQERVHGLKLLLVTEPYASWSNPRLASLVGLDRDTVAKYRPRPEEGASARVDARGRQYDAGAVGKRGAPPAPDLEDDEEPLPMPALDEDDDQPGDDDAATGDRWAAPALPGFEAAPAPIPATVAAGALVTQYLQKQLHGYLHGLNHIGVDPRTVAEHAAPEWRTAYLSELDGAIHYATMLRNRLQG